MSTEDRGLQGLAAQVGAALRTRGLRLVTVESCTGGLLAKLLTDVPGSSHWFDCGYVTYSNAAKQRDVAVHPQLLLRHGAVSEAVVRAMAEGALARTNADIAISISGVAGPDGGTARNPVGSVWLARAERAGEAVACLAQFRHFDGDRQSVRSQAAGFALQWLLAASRGEGSP